MKVRTNAQASQNLNFSQVRQASQPLQDPRYSDLLKESEGLQLKEVTRRLSYDQSDSRNKRLHAGDSLSNCLTLGVLASGTGLMAALNGHPGIASVAALFAAGASWGAVSARAQQKRLAKKEELARQLEAEVNQAGERLAATLVSDASDPGQIVDRRHYTGGVLKKVVTVHSRDSGLALRVKAEVVGSQLYQLESDQVERKVSVRSSLGESTFPGWMQIVDGTLLIHRTDPQISHAGSLVQTIRGDGESELRLTPRPDGYPRDCELKTSSLTPGDEFVASAYCWEKGQVATFVGNRLVVATPVLPFQELSPGNVRVLPEGVVGAHSGVEGSRLAVECSFPESYGPGTWCSSNSYTVKPRWVESRFGASTIRSDEKSDSFRASAADGSVLEGKGTLVFSQGAYRLEQSQAAGRVKQSLLAGEVLLELQDQQRSIRVQHRSGQPPRAVSQRHANFQEEPRDLTVVVTDRGSYQVHDGDQLVELAPPLPLFFLEKQKGQ